MDLEPIISRADLGAYLRRNVDGDDMALIAVNAASEVVRTVTGQPFVAGDTTTTFSARGLSSYLLLPNLPIVEVDEVRVDDEVTVDWELRAGGLLKSTDGCWPEGDANVAVDYSYGFDVVPDDVRMVALTIAARLYHQGIVRQETVGGSSTTFSTPASTDLSSGERLILGRYTAPQQSGRVDGVPV